MPFFQDLLPLLQGCEKLNLSLTLKGDSLTILVGPQPKKGSDAALLTPLVLTATAAQLDEGFAGALAAYSDERKSLAEQVEATNAVIASARNAQTDKAAKAISQANRGKGKTPAPADPEDADDDDDTQTDSASQTSAPAAAPAASEPPGTDLSSLI
ncbi:hypothetical protein BKK79_37220 (plasmid) [Cupriavidus sp. USMAA2-4]|uniref:PRTRC system protein E n=1 Tax=Cupriavidus sp. USMAA2-4 TaxID=876364 RepID=UPI0008A6C9FB|nr:PRTRC system protein E [Cupriavidus sp. USMAA2-4]AOY97579.1 hypothetical protein BKK79_37220 [Cupriavidus sp. USMAA2-4]